MNHLPSEVFDLYLDDRLDPSERVAVETHLATCPDCCRKLSALRALARHLDALPLEPMPIDLAPLVLRRITPAPRPWLDRLGVALLVAEVVAIAALGFWFGVQPPTSTAPALDLPSALDPTSLLVAWLGPLTLDPIPPLGDLFGASPVASFVPTVGDWPLLPILVAAIWLLGNRLLLADPARVDGRERGLP